MFENMDMISLAYLISGGILVLFAGLKLIKNGFALIFWLILFMAGLFLADYGLARSGIDLKKELYRKIEKTLNLDSYTQANPLKGLDSLPNLDSLKNGDALKQIEALKNSDSLKDEVEKVMEKLKN